MGLGKNELKFESIITILEYEAQHLLKILYGTDVQFFLRTTWHASKCLESLWF